MLSSRPTLRATRAFTLVEIMIVVAIIALLAAVAVPGFVRARKRSQATAILNDLRLIDAAVDRYGTENVLTSGTPVSIDAWKLYIKPGTRLYTTGLDIFNQPYGTQRVGVLPLVPAASFDDLSPIVDSTFWSPYVRGN